MDILQLVIDQVPYLNSGANQTLDILHLVIDQVPSLNSGANQTLDILQLVIDQVYLLSIQELNRPWINFSWL